MGISCVRDVHAMYRARNVNLPYTHSDDCRFRMLAVEIHMSLKCCRYLGFKTQVPDDEAEGAVSAR